MPPDSAPPTVWTVRSLLTWTGKYLAEKGIESAAMEARLLLGHVLGCRPIDVLVRYDDQPTAAEKTRYRELIQRRTEGWPVAYLTGTKEFYLLPFDVSPAVLIPRPDTETLVQFAVDVLKAKPAARVLDLGTGSGCIAVSIAQRVKSAVVTAVDISPDAAEVARRNSLKHDVASRVNVLVGDLFGPLPADAAFDLIVSNPPYIAPGEFAQLQVEVREHEPRVALDGGPDGLAFYRRIATDAGRFLVPGGVLAVEVGYTQDAAVRTLFAEADGLRVGESLKDLGGRLRVVTARRV